MNDIQIAKSYFEAMKEEIVSWRRRLHRHPEIAFEEKWTAGFIAETLEGFGYEVHRGLGKTGVVAAVPGKEGPAVGLRADMDALAVEEENDLPYKSGNPGKMHACGHDGHMAMLLAAAKYVAENSDLFGKIYFIFQPGEEVEGGAEIMIKDGLFKRFPMEAVYGLHNWPGLTEGVFSARVGPQMAAFDIFSISLHGQGAHGAMPHQGDDLLVAAGQLCSQMQTIVSRSVNPLDTAVVSITQIHGGDAYNVLPSRVVLKGSTRHFTREVQELVERRMKAVCEGIAVSFGIRVEMDYRRRYPATVNSEAETALALKAASTVAKPEDILFDTPPSMASEDFGFMLEEKPGCYVWLGSGRGDDNPLHSPAYDFNDNLLTIGASYWIAVATAAASGSAPRP